MMTEQPTHHGYAVNVKDYETGPLGDSPLSEADVQAIYDEWVEVFWYDAQAIAQSHGFEGAWSEGRMGGWCKPYPQPSEDGVGRYVEYVPDMARWMHDRFRPFERDILACMAERLEDFRADLSDAVTRAHREPEEVAYWAARDIETVPA